MNTLQTRYAQHVEDIYGISNATVPEIKPQELFSLTTSVTRQIQPLLFADAMQRRLEAYRAEYGEDAELILYHEALRMSKVSVEISYLNNFNHTVDVRPLAEELCQSLGLEGIVDINPNGKLNIGELRKVLKTAYWLNRNL